MTRTLDKARGLLSPKSISGGPLAGFRNKIINGNFDIWQRGTSQTSSSYGSADRWSNIHTGSAKTTSQKAFTAGQTDVPGNPEYFMRTVVSSVTGAGNYAIAIQKIENLRQFAGKTVTVTFYAKADSVKDICNEFYQYYGTGGSPSAPVSGIGSTTQPLTTSWQKFSYTVDIPSDVGKVYGTDGNHHLELLFWFDAGTTHDARTNSLGQQSGTFDIAHISLVEGDATLEDDPFEARHIGQELALCQRYYEEGSGHGVSYNSSGAAVQRSEVFFMQPKRAGSTYTTTKVGGTATAPAPVITFTELNGFVFGYTSTGASQDITITWTADAEL